MSYTANVPLSGQSLGSSRPIINTNFTTLQTIFDKNHVDYNASGGGKHKFVEIPISGAIPAGLTANEGTLYTKTVSAASELFYTPDTSTNQYQLTKTISAQFAKFSTNTAYAAQHVGGWTFLPGGMILQYGVYTSIASSGTISFPFTFPTGVPFTVLISVEKNLANITVDVKAGTITTSGFDFIASIVSVFNIHWFAIGK